MSNYTSALNPEAQVSATRKMVFIGVLGAVSFVLMMINFSLPFAPAFLKFDIAELPALFAGFFMGPAAGFVVIIVKILLKLVIQGTDTAFVGEFSNLAGSAVFVLIAAFIYKKNRTKKGAVIGMLASSIAVSVLFIFINAYVMFPLYSELYGMPMEAIIGMGSAINPAIRDMTTMMLFSVFPFNLFKHIVTSLLTFLVYKRVGAALRRILYT
ncbi:MAG: ECF transporter S component [Lachnospiraceae bacterium]|nr:ECF transporter S component [Lachnospiraceae bacterium]